MNKIIALAAASFALAVPALAGTMTIELAPEGGEVVSITLNDADSTFEMTGDVTGVVNGTYTWDEATRTLCGSADGSETCATFEAADGEPHVGSTSGYTATNGEVGTATITAMTE